MQCLLSAALLLAPTLLAAQAERAVMRGVVLAGGEPVAGANVFVVGTVDGALTDSLGRFQFSTPRAPAYTIAIRRLGFRERLRLRFGAEAEFRVTTAPGAGGRVEIGLPVVADDDAPASPPVAAPSDGAPEPALR